MRLVLALVDSNIVHYTVKVVPRPLQIVRAGPFVFVIWFTFVIIDCGRIYTKANEIMYWIKLRSPIVKGRLDTC